MLKPHQVKAQVKALEKIPVKLTIPRLLNPQGNVSISPDTMAVLLLQQRVKRSLKQRKSVQVKMPERQNRSILDM